MKKIICIFVCFLLAACLLACGMSTDEISEMTRTGIQQKFDTDFKELKIKVVSVDVFKQSKNLYKGSVKIVYAGDKTKTFTASITASDNDVLWEVEPSKLIFLIPEMMRAQSY